MDKWVDCGSDFVVGDVVRWREAVWLKAKRKTRKKKPEKIGDRRITAQVAEADSRGFVRLVVIEDEILSNKYGMPLKRFAKDATITKKRSTIAKGAPQRRKHLDESARAHAVSRFLN